MPISCYCLSCNQEAIGILYNRASSTGQNPNDSTLTIKLISLTSIIGAYLFSFHQTYETMPLSAAPSLIHLALLACPGERCSSCRSSGITQARRRKRTIIFNICQTHDSNSSPFPPTHHTHTHAHKPKESTKNGGVLLF